EGGTLLVPHGPGLVLSFVSPPGGELTGLFPRSLEARPVDVKAPARVALDGRAVALKIALAEPALIELVAPGPSVSLVSRAGQPDESAVHTPETALSAYLPAGASEIRLRAPAGGTLSGHAEVLTRPVTAIGDGLGPATLLGPGSSRLFSFRVT